MRHTRFVTSFLAAVLLIAAPLAFADETCNSPYMGNLIKGQEDYVYVWTLGVKGLGDGFDKLVTIDANPASAQYGKVIHKVSVGGRGEAHHMGFTDDRRFLWAGGLDDSKIFIFDVGTDPAKPKVVRRILDFASKTGFVGPHTFYAMPGRMLVQGLSNTKDNGGATGFAVYSNRGELINVQAMPTDKGGDGYGYDLAINPQKNVMLSSSFTGRANYMRELGKLVGDAEAMKKFGSTMVVWDLKALTPKKGKQVEVVLDNLNVPSCTTGEVRGQVEVPVAGSDVTVMCESFVASSLCVTSLRTRTPSSSVQLSR